MAKPEYAARAGIESRSSMVREAIGPLRAASLEDAYIEAWQEWQSSEDEDLWDSTVADGVDDASR